MTSTPTLTPTMTMTLTLTPRIIRKVLMSSIHEMADRAMATAKLRKETLIAENDDDMPQTVLFRRGAEIIAALGCHNATHLLPAIEIGINGFGADSAAAIIDSYVCTRQERTAVSPPRNPVIDPDTGRQWAPGAMAQYLQRHGPNNGMVGRALEVHAANAAQDVAARFATYEVLDGRVVWADIEVPDHLHGGASADLQNTLIRAMSAAPALAVERAITAAQHGVSHAEALVTGDTVTAAYMSALDVVVALVADPSNTERARLLDRVDGLHR